MTDRHSLPDAAARQAIVTELDKNFLVEAAAGTGKTTSLAERFVALVVERKENISSIAAVTFARQGAAQLREKIAQKLEERNLAGTRDSLDRAFLGTIHSFCARLLRERPVEAGIDPAFVEPEKFDEALLRDAVWQEYVTRLGNEDPQKVAHLGELGVELRDLKKAYERVAEYPDVKPVSTPVASPDFREVRRQVEGFLDDLIPKLKNFGLDSVPDEFAGKAWRGWYFRQNNDLSNPAACGRFLEILKSGTLTQKKWPNKGLAKETSQVFKELREKYIAPALEAWHTYRHHDVMGVILPVVAEFRRRRIASGRPDFTDLLLLCRDMLRDYPEVRRDFQKRYPYLLVDEFQDTDPIQAEVMLYLTGEDLREKNWKRLKPRPGSLFVVGDPKQSIYGFRRADIETYNTVKAIIQKTGGEVVSLSTCFRLLPSLCGWVNSHFETIFDETIPHQARHVALVPFHSGTDEFTGVFRLVSEVAGKRNAEICAADAEAIAGWIAAAIANQGRHASEFLIVLREKKYLDFYARALESRGVACEVTGGGSLSASEEFKTLFSLLQALLDPDNPIPFVAFLRGSLCGVDDVALYRFRKAGGEFSFRAQPAEGTDPRIVRALGQLTEAERLIRTLPPSAAISRICELLAIFPGSFTDNTSRTRAGNVAKFLAVIRHLSGKGESLAEIVENLGTVTQIGDIGEMNIEPFGTNAVRVMNLHKVKGLEAPVVFLAGPVAPAGNHDGPDASIDRETNPPAGHFLVSRKFENNFAAQEIARPAGWSERATHESEYQKAEDGRLLYVAATRAMQTLVVSATMDVEAKSPRPSFGSWEEFISLPDVDLPRLTAKNSSREILRVDFKAEFDAVKEEISKRVSALAVASYAVASVTSVAHAAEGAIVREETGKGMAWGRILHRMLEAVMSDRDGTFDRKLYAANLLREEERPPEEAPEVLELVSVVEKSELWRRAKLAQLCLTEVPFAIKVSSKELTLPGAPAETLLNGTIDLVFRENGVWHLIDYKSDRISGSVEELVRLYAPQVAIYRNQWAKLTGEKTRAGLYFINRPEEVRWVE